MAARPGEAGTGRRRAPSFRTMQPAGRSRSLGRLGTFGLVAALIALAGCSGSLASMLPGTGPLVTVRLEGGMCPAGMCTSTWVIERDGRVLSEADPPEELGRARADAMTALAAAVRSADYAAIRAKPFRDTCPTAWDGQELILEFHAPDGVQRIASCEVEIDWGHPLFVATVAAISPFLELQPES